MTFVRNMLVLPPGLFRLLLAALVVVSHMSRLEVGRIAVMLFFVLSGYWVSVVFEREYKGQALSFYLSRIWRLAPIYLTVLIAAAVARGHDLGVENFTIVGVATTGRDPTGVSWSLDIEMQFYLALPILLYLAHRVGLSVLLAGTVVLTGAGWWCSEWFGIETVAKYLPAFAIGIALARTNWNPGERTAVASAAAFVLATLLLMGSGFGRDQLDKMAPDIVNLDVFAMIWALPLIPYVARSLHRKSGGADKKLGDLSYPLYLVHYPLLALVAAGGVTTADKLIVVGGSMALAVMLYWLVDTPSERLRKRTFAAWHGRGSSAGSQRATLTQ